MAGYWLGSTGACMEKCSVNRSDAAVLQTEWLKTAGKYMEQDALMSGCLNLALNSALLAAGSIIGQAVAARVITGIQSRMAIAMIVGGYRSGQAFRLATMTAEVAAWSESAAAVYGNVFSFLIVNGLMLTGKTTMQGSLVLPNGGSVLDGIAALLGHNSSKELFGGVLSLLYATATDTYATANSFQERQTVSQATLDAQDKALAAVLDDARRTLKSEILNGGGEILVQTFLALRDDVIPALSKRTMGDVVTPALALPLGLNPLSGSPTPQEEFDQALKYASYYDTEMVLWAQAYELIHRVDAAFGQAWSMLDSLDVWSYLPGFREHIGLTRGPY